jgi:hypothetical protein
MSKSLAIGLFLLMLAVGVMFGIARDLYSRERGIVKGTVAEIDAGGAASKAQPLRGPCVKVKLADGSIVDVAVTGTSGLKANQTVEVVEMVMPWGQVWYKLKGE